MTNAIAVEKASHATSAEVVSHLPEAGKTASKIGTVAMVVQVLNGLDMLLGLAGIVPVGTVPAVANGVVAIFGGVTQWWAKRKAVKIAYFTQS